MLHFVPNIPIGAKPLSSYLNTGIKMLWHRNVAGGILKAPVLQFAGSHFYDIDLFGLRSLSTDGTGAPGIFSKIDTNPSCARKIVIYYVSG